MFVPTVQRYANNHRRLLLIFSTAALYVFLFSTLFASFFDPSEDESSYSLKERSKRHVGRQDPFEDYIANELLYEQQVKRVSRKILDESESYTEENGVKMPIPIKELNKEHAEAKRLYFAKMNCVEERPETTTVGPETSAPAVEGSSDTGGGEAPSSDDGGGDSTTEAPAEKRRRRRGALEITTERVYYCDEFTTTPPPTTPSTAPSAPAEGEGDPAAAAPDEGGDTTPASER